MQPDITVIVPVLNASEQIHACLDGLLRQTIDREKYQVVVVDNGSTDGSFETAMSFTDVTVMRFDEPDPYLARNAGVTAADAEVVAFTDAHCIADRNWLAEIWGAFYEDRAGLVAGPIGFPRTSSQVLKLYDTYHQSKLAYVYSNSGEHLFAHAGNLAVRKELFTELGGFCPLPMPGDTEFVHRVRRERPAVTVTYLPGALVRRQTVGTFPELLGKTRKHRMYNRTLSGQGVFRTLQWRDRWRVFLACRKQHQLTIVQSALLLWSLAVGVVVYEFGPNRER